MHACLFYRLYVASYCSMPHILTCYCVTLQNDAEKLDTASSSVFDIDGFIEYLQSLSGGNKSYNVAKAIAADISLFFERISHGSTDTYYNILLNTRNLHDYIKHLQINKQFSPSTVSEKLRILRQAIEYTEAKENNLKVNHKLLSRCHLIAGLLTKWGKSLHKDIAKQRRKQNVISQQQVRAAHNPNEFLESPSINASVRQILSKAESSEITSFDHLTVITFLAANIIFTNAQRPGVVQYMTVQEFDERTETGNEQSLIVVMEHKTAMLGPAHIVISSTVDKLMMQYMNNVRTRVHASEYSARLFLTSTGNEFCKISEKIAYVARYYNLKTPTACLHRKVISSAGYEELDPKDYQSLNEHMSHSPHTAYKYYQCPGTASKAAVMHDHIVKLTKK